MAGISAGIVDDEALLDLQYSEDSRAQVDLNCIMNEQGEMTCIRSEHPQKYNITVKVVATAEYEEGIGYSVNGCRVAIGEMLDMRFPQYTCSGACTQIYE